MTNDERDQQSLCIRHSSFGFDSDFEFRHSGFSRAVVWCDLTRNLYPPALLAAGVNPRDLWILRPRTEQEELWAVAECLRCKGVGVTVARLPARLQRNDVRRLQLAAERGGGLGIIMRPMARGSEIYAAATRWLVEPARGDRTIQRWKLTLLHGHGGQVGQSIFLERCRENNLVRATAQLADRSSFAADPTPSPLRGEGWGEGRNIEVNRHDFAA